ncbi:MAG: type II toxin-antitoxin system HicB family antitoxin [Candidatus Algichlamydia australiensis]|nr:type II toxin-antitoxin system HicB family antitoxin [Chlamydiales bacterium]
MVTKKEINYYINLNWTYTIETEKQDGTTYFIVRVNELPGVCTDGDTVEEAMENIKEAIEAAIYLYLKNGEPVPVPIQKEKFKGNIAYRTTQERHYHIAKLARNWKKSISKTIDNLIDEGIEKFRDSA